jgi:prepilin-type N-terminal cleavage/methylation domain-containing protein
MKKVRGFTIVELLIVIVVIAILASIVIVSYNGAQIKSQQAKIQSDLTNVRQLVENYFAQHGSYPVTATNLNPDWATTTARTDANCSMGTHTSDWVPGLGVSLPQSTSGKGVGGLPGCYIYASDGTNYIISGWNMLSQPQNTVSYRRLGFREMDPSHATIFYICNHTNIGGNSTGVYDINSDYYKHSITLSNITSSGSGITCNETPPAGA